MIHPKTELKFINNEIGYGVVATEFIPAGTITWAIDKLDREFSPLEFQSMDFILYTYTFKKYEKNYNQICIYIEQSEYIKIIYIIK